MDPLILWVGLSVLIAFLGRNRSVGPWGFLLFSLVFSPVIGALGLFVAGPRRREPEPPSPDIARLTSAVQALQHASMRQQALLDDVHAELRGARGTEPIVRADVGNAHTH